MFLEKSSFAVFVLVVYGRFLLFIHPFARFFQNLSILSAWSFGKYQLVKMSQPQGRRGMGRGRGRPLADPAPVGSSNNTVTNVTTTLSQVSNVGAGRGQLQDDPPVSVPPPISGSPDAPIDDLADKAKDLEIIDLVGRPGFGVAGVKGQVFANYFEVQMKCGELNVIQYHIDVTHERLKLTRDEKRICFNKCVASNLDIFNNKFAVTYDGDHLCICVKQLQFPNRRRPGLHGFEIKIRLPRMEREETILVQFQFVGLVHVSTRGVNPSATRERYTTPMHILDILCRQQRSCLSKESAKVWYPYGPTMYRIPEQGGPDLTCGRVIWQGLFGAAHVGQNYTPYINFDVSHSGFYKPQSMIEFMIDILNDKFSSRRGVNDFSVKDLNPNTKLAPNWIHAINKEIKGLKVVMDVHRANGESYEREYSVNGLVAGTAVTQEFEMRTEDGSKRKTTVAEYFKERYGNLRFPNLSLLHVGPRKRDCYIPMEVCQIARNQRVNKKLSADQLAVMIRAAAIDAPSRRRKVVELVQQSAFDNDPWLKTFGVRIDSDMKKVDARILPAPKIQYALGARSTVEPRDGVWDCRGQKFIIPASCDKIGALVIDDRDHQIYKEFFSFLFRTCNEMGMRVPNQIDLSAVRAISPDSTSQIEPKLTELVQMGATFIIVTIPQKSSVFYSEVKRMAEIVLGVMTQCVVKANIMKTMKKQDRMVTTNIALKINTKLGGVNSKAQAEQMAHRVLMDQPTLVLGIDVTHPSPMEQNAPSVASVVGNLDDTFMRYGASVRVQKHRREAMVYLQEPVRERLVEYFRYGQMESEKRQKAVQPVKENQKPQRLIVFRDGVAEGQFQEVLREELTGIREACKQLGSDYKPKITLIVAQKRHHTRFFPMSQQAACGKAMNVRPGTVVDGGITHPEQFEFYLCSHFGIQGTSRPIRYHVLYDDNNFSVDHIQLMTYYMCHLYARCTRTVSIPAPIYYADLACRRARAHLYDKISDFSSDTISHWSGTAGETSGISEDELIKSSTVADGLRFQMYFS